MSNEESEKFSTHHLMRVRVHTRIFAKLRVIAEAECRQTNTYVSVSDLVRSAILNFLRTYEPLATDTKAITADDSDVNS
jgi:hypothetical protein